MKIEQDTEEFKPITITIQSKEEAELFYHMFNCSPTYALEKYCETEDTDIDLKSLHHSVGNQFFDIYVGDRD